MDESLQAYLGEQLSLFTGGYDHLMLEFTVHLHGNTNRVDVGVGITHPPSGERIALQAFPLTGDATLLALLAQDLTDVLEGVLRLVDPF